MKRKSSLLIVLLLYGSQFVWFNLATSTGERTRIRVLRTEEEKKKYLNDSRIAKDNFFFGMRPILYVSRYSCNCPTDPPISTNTQPGSNPGANAGISQFPPEPPEFPPEELDEVVPPVSDAAHPNNPRLTELGSSASSLQPEKDDDEEEFELLISHARGEHQVIDTSHFQPFDAYGRPIFVAIRSRPLHSGGGGRRRRIRRRFNQQQQPMQQMNHRSIRLPNPNVVGTPIIL